MKEFLSQKQITFEERDIAKDPTAISDLQKLGFMTTPVTIVGEQVIIGFDQAKLEKALVE